MKQRLLFSSASSSSRRTRSLRKRARLLDAARGLLRSQNTGDTTSGSSSSSSSSTGSAPAPPPSSSSLPTAPLPCFALKAEHVGQGRMKNNGRTSTTNLIGASPSEFHTRLVDLIRNAQRRVSLASLYIGPAAVPHQSSSKERELLQALSQVPSHVNVQIVMDRNRGLRQVPTNSSTKDDTTTTTSSSTSTTTTTTTSAAQAVASAIHKKQQHPQSTAAAATTKSTATTSNHINHQLYLCQVLPTPYDTLLPNPLNEVAGVFHIKAYIVDDTLILSGANLSEEYFTDRHDRYFLVENHVELVNFYVQLLDILCQYASEPYYYYHHDDDDDDVDNEEVVVNAGVDAKNNNNNNNNNNNSGKKKKKTTASSSRIGSNRTNPRIFWEKIQELFARHHQSHPLSAEALLQDPETVAVCVPTFHHPQLPPPPPPPPLHSLSSFMPSDVDCTLNLLSEAAAITAEEDDDDDEESKTEVSVQLSSAYLNPPRELLRALSRFRNVDFLTAGRLSHGFRPKPSSSAKVASGNKGKAWIPTVFDHLQSQALDTLYELSSASSPSSSSSSSLSANNGNNNNNTTTSTSTSTTTTLWHWERPDWTFHAKGLWITAKSITAKEEGGGEEEASSSPSPPASSSSSSSSPDLLAAMVGSSNFGRRSWERDMESNLILIFPPRTTTDSSTSCDDSTSLSSSSSSLATQFQDEWKLLLSHSSEQTTTTATALAAASGAPGAIVQGDLAAASHQRPPKVLVGDLDRLPWHVRVCYPFIQSFF